MSLRPFFSFYGGKWRLARRYPAPAHVTLIEPFAGSAGYALRYPDRKVWLNDADPVIYGTWAYLQRASTAEILSLPDLEPGQSVRDLDVPQEARWLIGWWLNAAAAMPHLTPSLWARNATNQLFWSERVRLRLVAQQPQIAHWKITNLDYTRLPDRRATWFVDPPYEVMRHCYRHRITDYAQLAKWCRARRGQVLVCENEGARWLPFRPFHVAKAQKRGRPSREVLWSRAA